MSKPLDNLKEIIEEKPIQKNHEKKKVQIHYKIKRELKEKIEDVQKKKNRESEKWVSEASVLEQMIEYYPYKKD
jgi:hypothetical protein